MSSLDKQININKKDFEALTVALKVVMSSFKWIEK